MKAARCAARPRSGYLVETLAGPESPAVDGMRFRSGVALVPAARSGLAFSFVLEDGGAVYFGTSFGHCGISKLRGPGFPSDPYSFPDPKLSAAELAIAMFPAEDMEGEYVGADAARPLIKPLETFLTRLDQDVLDAFADRAPTVSEYCFLAARGRKAAQAAAAYPWLVPFLLSSLSPNADPPARDAAGNILATIERAGELLPVLAETLGVPKAVVRGMAGIPVGNLTAERWLRNDLVAFAQCLAAVIPERRPDRGNWDGFLSTLAWCQEAVDGNADPAVLPPLVARVWGTRLRGGRGLQDIRDVRWVLHDIREAVERAHGFGGYWLEGTVCGVRASMLPGEWVAFDLFFRNPAGLVSEGRKWHSTVVEAVRDGVGAEFGDWPLPRFLDRSYESASGYRVAQIDSVSDLVGQAREALNCIASYLPPLLARNFIMLSVHGPDGNLAGHAELTVEGNATWTVPGMEMPASEPAFWLPEIAEKRGVRNGKIPEPADRALKQAVDRIAGTRDFRAFFVSVSTQCDDPHAIRARQFVDSVSRDCQVDRAIDAVTDACRRYGLKLAEDQSRGKTRPEGRGKS